MHAPIIVQAIVVPSGPCPIHVQGVASGAVRELELVALEGGVEQPVLEGHVVVPRGARSGLEGVEGCTAEHMPRARGAWQLGPEVLQPVHEAQDSRHRLRGQVAHAGTDDHVGASGRHVQANQDAVAAPGVVSQPAVERVRLHSLGLREEHRVQGVAADRGPQQLHLRAVAEVPRGQDAHPLRDEVEPGLDLVLEAGDDL
mmetsp:Transcript_13793/g.27880  ORF Transcript_13793/g.27880 Transcript_13793/m.27880 type:complete len:200 (-) Transcript_13793:1472-2071(-)